MATFAPRFAEVATYLLYLKCVIFGQSRPMRARGLKHFPDDLDDKYFKSRPMRARGLKQDAAIAAQKADVAPHAGAWIETPPRRCIAMCTLSRPMRARGLKRSMTQWEF